MDWSSVIEVAQEFWHNVMSDIIAYVWYAIGSVLFTGLMWNMPKWVRQWFPGNDPVALLRQRLPNFRVVHFNDIEVATDREVQDYYVGRLNLNWKIVKREAIIKRTVTSQVLERYAHSPTKLEIICIHGDVASGKSAVAWDVAYTMASKTKCQLLQDLNKEKVGWQEIENLFYEQNTPILIVVDDIFDRMDYVDRMTALPEDLPLRVIASSRTIDIPHAFAKSFDQFVVGAPDEHEINQAIQIVGGTADRKLKTPPKSWLGLMIELSSNQSFEEYIHKSTLKLSRSPDAYTAYLYVCFCSQFNVPLLADVLTKITPGLRDPQRSLAGYVFVQEMNQQRAFVTAHALIADTVIQKIAQERPQQLLQTILGNVDYAVAAQRQFVIILLGAIQTRQRVQYQAFLRFDAAEVAPLLTQITHAELLRLTVMFDVTALDARARAGYDELCQRLLNQVPTTVEDWQAYFVLSNRISHTASFDVITEARKFITSHDEPMVRVHFLQYLGTVPRSGTIESLLSEAQPWVNSQSPVNLVIALASLAQKYGNRAPRQQILTTVLHWMNTNGIHNTVFDLYVSLVSGLNTAAVEEAISWAKRHVTADASWHIRKSYLRLLQLHNDQQAIRELYEQLMQTGFAQYNSEAFEIILMVVTTLDDAQLSRSVIATHLHAIDQIAMRKTALLLFMQLGDTMLAEFPGDKEVRELLEEMLKYVAQWLKENRDARIYEKYIDLIIGLDNKTLGTENIRELMTWIDAEAHTTEGLKYYINFLKLSALYASQALMQAQIPRAVAVLNTFPDNMYLRLAILHVIAKYSATGPTPVEITQDAIKQYMVQTFAVLRGQQQEQLQQVSMAYYRLLHQFVRLCVRYDDGQFVGDVITQVLQWLAQKSPRREWAYTCTSLIALIRIKGSWAHVTSIVVLGKQWLSSSVFTQTQKQHMHDRYSQLIETCGNDEMKLDFYHMTQKWESLLQVALKMLQQNPLKSVCLEYALRAAYEMSPADGPMVKDLLMDASNWVFLNPTNDVFRRYLQLALKYGDQEDCKHVHARMVLFRDARPNIVLADDVWEKATSVRQRR